MKINWYLIKSGKLLQQPPLAGTLSGDKKLVDDRWLDVEAAQSDELRQLLAPLNLHPHMLTHILAPKNIPNSLSYGNAFLLEYPLVFEQETNRPENLELLLKSPVLVTIHSQPIPALESLTHSLLTGELGDLQHLPQIIYLILGGLADLNVQSEIEIRDQILNLARTLDEKPAKVKAGDLTKMRRRVDQLVSMIENQLYCAQNLNNSDNKILQEPHRKAYLQDLITEAEVAQRGVYRLESRVNDLYAFYQAASNDRVEKRLRLLTIVSAITLPLGLITGLLGMNVGGLPGTSAPNGFIFVIALMVSLGIIEFLYFKYKGWFD